MMVSTIRFPPEVLLYSRGFSKCNGGMEGKIRAEILYKGQVYNVVLKQEADQQLDLEAIKVGYFKTLLPNV